MGFCKKIHGKCSGGNGNNMNNKSFNDVFSKNLRYYFDLSGMTQAEFAKKLGVGTTSIYNWLSGVKNPRMDKVDSMCKLLGIHREDLITDNLAREEEIAPFIGELQLSNEMNYKNRFISALLQLDDKEWKVIEKFTEILVAIKKD
jgi:transcriptional regulator with XRE-family HTH domain|nr:MAG TPA: Repressor protein CI [Caudoviricetes sp.]